MKKTIMTIGGAIFVGCVFGFLYFKNTKDNIADAFYIDNQATAFQVGVYKNYSNASVECEKYESGTIINDGEFYRVYIALSNDEELTTKLESYYKSKNVHYYLKKIVLPKEFLTTFDNYQKVLLNTNDYDSINRNLLKEYSEFIDGVYD